MTCADGVVLARDNVRVVDTREMAWQDHPGLEGAKTKVLSRRPDGRPALSLTWVPPGLTSFHPDGPELHYHRTITERVFVLAGEITLREAEALDARDWERVTYRSGYFLDRGPGSVHGIDPDRPSPVGLLFLEWVEGDGPVYAGDDPDGIETERRFG